jgi:hypothetical protein
MYTGLINLPAHSAAPTATTPAPVTNVPITSTSSANYTSQNRAQPWPVAAVGLWADDTLATFPSTSSALEGGSDGEDEDSDKVSASFCAPHLW